ncbi:hypothetical protein OsJ_13994 [Oryza sativa Japonica Group]|uniref:Gnk2-homologous domain-containing protein n=1 Tax=Oryza sativa subsp. japonica TaxID=39947 RepID=A3ARK1_ORYSJ|nr:hypothetical protein OsJ_13994 [Oryza sativa Japonica Group]
MDSNLAVLLAIVVAVVCVARTTPPAFAQTVQVWSECSPQNYTAGSAYGTSLRGVLKDVVDAAVSGGGYAVANDAGCAAHGLAICYADAPPEVSRLCLAMAPGNLSLACPRAVGGAMLYNKCLLRAGDAAQFGAALSRLMDRLALAAASSSSSSRGRRFAFGQTNITGDGGDSLYAFVQCVDDLSPDDCRRCLQSIAASLPMTRGGRAYSLTCYTRFEVVPFYRPPTATNLVVVASTAPAPESALLPTESRGE